MHLLLYYIEEEMHTEQQRNFDLKKMFLDRCLKGKNCLPKFLLYVHWKVINMECRISTKL